MEVYFGKYGILYLYWFRWLGVKFPHNRPSISTWTNNDAAQHQTLRRRVVHSTVQSTLPSTSGKRVPACRCPTAAPQKTNWSGQTSRETPRPSCSSAWARCLRKWGNLFGRGDRRLVHWKKTMPAIRLSQFKKEMSWTKRSAFTKPHQNWRFFEIIRGLSVISHHESIGMFHSARDNSSQLSYSRRHISHSLFVYDHTFFYHLSICPYMTSPYLWLAFQVEPVRHNLYRTVEAQHLKFSIHNRWSNTNFKCLLRVKRKRYW